MELFLFYLLFIREIDKRIELFGNSYKIINLIKYKNLDSSENILSFLTKK